MSIAISDSNLREIYNLSYEDKLDLVDLIIKSMRSAANKMKNRTREADASWVSQFEGQWKDSKSVEEMLADLKSSRTSNSEVVL